MAELSTSGLEEIIGDLEDIATLPDDLVLEMLTAEAEIVAAAQEAEARAMGVFDKGITAGSITHGKKLTVRGSERCLYVYPRGTRTDGNTRRVAEVAYVNEYGKEGQPARPFVNTANEKAIEAAVDAAEKVYDKYLKSKNL